MIIVETMIIQDFAAYVSTQRRQLNYFLLLLFVDLLLPLREATFLHDLIPLLQILFFLFMIILVSSLFVHECPEILAVLWRRIYSRR